MPPPLEWEAERCYALAMRLPRFAFLAVRRREVFFGTFWPAARASERPIVIAWLRLLTLRPERPLRNVPALRFFIVRSTVLDAFLEYFRAMMVLPWAEDQSAQKKMVPVLTPGPRLADTPSHSRGVIHPSYAETTRPKR